MIETEYCPNVNQRRGTESCTQMVYKNIAQDL